MPDFINVTVFGHRGRLPVPAMLAGWQYTRIGPFQVTAMLNRDGFHTYIDGAPGMHADLRKAVRQSTHGLSRTHRKDLKYAQHQAAVFESKVKRR